MSILPLLGRIDMMVLELLLNHSLKFLSQGFKYFFKYYVFLPLSTSVSFIQFLSLHSGFLLRRYTQYPYLFYDVQCNILFQARGFAICVSKFTHTYFQKNLNLTNNRRIKYYFSNSTNSLKISYELASVMILTLVKHIFGAYDICYCRP